MRKIRFAVIGQGHIGKRHAEMIRRNEQSELIAVCDVLSKEQLGITDITESFYSSIDILLKEVDVDVVNICVPNGLHAEFALKVLNAHKHVVIEKPMALSKQDAERILSRSLEVGCHVFCVMQNRYSPPSKWLKEVVESGVLGDIYMVHLDCFWNRDARYYNSEGWHGDALMDGGTLYTQFSHFVDIMYWLFGDITNIKASFYDFNHKDLTDFEDSGTVIFDFIQGGSGCLNYSTSVWGKNLESSLTIVAQNGSIKVAGQYMNEVTYCHIKDYQMPLLEASNPPNDYGLYKGSAQNHHYVIQNVIDKLIDKALITTNALDGLKVVDIIERIYKAKG